MQIWRIHLKPGAEEGIDPRKFCLDRGIVGVGYAIYDYDYTTTPVSWEEYERIYEKTYGNEKWIRSWHSSVRNAMKNNMRIDDLVWTRDYMGKYYLGRVTSDWFYDDSDENSKADIVNVRKCEWHEIGTVDNVPGKVVSCFVPSRTIQSIGGDTVKIFSQIMYNRKSKGDFYNVGDLSGQNIFDLLSADDCEDALAIYLQVLHGYYLIPSSRSFKNDTACYEYALKSKGTGKTAVAQVKSGNVSLNIDDFSALNTDVYLFATSGEYYGIPKSNIKKIDPEEIRKFLYDKTALLPDKMKIWVELTR